MPDDYYKVAYSHNLLVTALLSQFRDDVDELMMTRELSRFDPELADLLFARDYNVAFWSEHVVLHRLSTYPSSLFLSLGKNLLKFLSKKRLERSSLGARFPYGLPNLNDVYYVLEDGVDWMIKNLSGLPQPFLGYFHYLPPHEPYTPRQDFVDKFLDGWKPKPKPDHVFGEGFTRPQLNRERQLYDEFLAYSDAEFGRLYDELERQGVLDNTTVIFTSDHGEMFERGIRGHVTYTLYEPVIRIPLLIARAGQTQRVDVHTPTSAVDVLPTLLQDAGLPAPEWCEGIPLPAGPADEKPGRSIYAVEAKTNSKFTPLKRATFAMIRDNYKLIHYRGYPQLRDHYEFYDLDSDPEEMDDRFPAAPSEALAMKEELLAQIDAANRPFETG
jgi:arylsulfatase A-like enzyme